MARDPRYDILFEPVPIGPVTARSRFYQVPHCSGMGHRYPNSEAAMRAMKAEGGWAVVCTQEAEIHATADISPGAEARIWSEKDLPALAKVVDAVHEHGALAGIQLVHNGPHAACHYSREVPVAPSNGAPGHKDPVQPRAMTKADIRTFIRWHRDAALRAKRVGFDLIYVYAGHDLSMPMHFISRRWNQRSDEYGGSLENRVRLLKELIEDTKEAVGDTCAVAVRLAVDELLGDGGICCNKEGHDVVEMLAELPDLWDVNISDWSNDSATSRFSAEGFQEEYVKFVKTVTTKPVVGVGRFTSPDTMVSQIKRGVLDFIGAARPSIADPFLPKKIEEGRPEDIRECIGCNICVSGDHLYVPMRCTQNPTVGEEWRRGWHPERIAGKTSDAQVLVVGAGPAGLECALALGQRGYEVVLSEAGRELGGRVASECRLPGLSSWGRVRDYRQHQLEQMPNVEIYRDSALSAEQILEFEFPHVVLATGSRWRKDGVGRANRTPIPGSESAHVLAPENVYSEDPISGPVVVYDDDHYYLGGVLAEKLKSDGHEVTLVTPAVDVSHWTANTLEQIPIQSRLMRLGVKIVVRKIVTDILNSEIELKCFYTSERTRIAASTVVMVTSRLPNDSVHTTLHEDEAQLRDAGINSVTPIGDCQAPATIALAVYAGHRCAREFGQELSEGVPFRREMAELFDEQ